MRPGVITIIVIVLVGAFLGWFFLTHERVPNTSYTGYRGEARFNDFLTAELLLEEFGYEAESRATLQPSKWLPDYGDTLFTRMSPSIAVGDERSRLDLWVQEGGHLILLPPVQESELNDALLRSFGYEFVWTELDADEASDDDDTAEEEGSAEEIVYDYILDLDFQRLRIVLVDDSADSITLSDDYGNIAARRTWGAGYVTVVSTPWLWSNSYLASSDHARFFMDAVAGYVEPGKTWLIYDASFVPLWKLIWDNARFAVLGSAALLLVALWAVMPVFGPTIRADVPVRRSIIEHIKAAGTFVWKQHGGSALGESAAKAVLHDAERRHPGIGRLSRANQAQLIARLTGLDAQAVMDAIADGGEPHAREFTQHMEILHDIRNKL